MFTSSYNVIKTFSTPEPIFEKKFVKCFVKIHQLSREYALPYTEMHKCICRRDALTNTRKNMLECVLREVREIDVIV